MVVVEHRGEDAVLARERPDRLPLGVADAVHHELGEAAVVVGDAEGGVLGVEEFAGGGDDRLEDVADLQGAAHREQRGTHREEPGAGRPAAGPGGARGVGHAVTLPAGGGGCIGPGVRVAGAVGLGPGGVRPRAKCPGGVGRVAEAVTGVTFLRWAGRWR